MFAMFGVEILLAVVGVLFAVLATWLTTTPGNRIVDTIREAAKNSNFDIKTLQVELGKVKIATVIPIVALYIVSAATVLTPPLYWLWLDTRGTIQVHGPVQFPHPGAGSITVRNTASVSAGAYDIRVPIFGQQLNYVLTEGKKDTSVNITIGVNLWDNKVCVINVDLLNDRCLNSKPIAWIGPSAVVTETVAAKLDILAAGQPPSNIPTHPGANAKVLAGKGDPATVIGN
jgi:hypothetical protein